jgi:hypothetical protein
MTDTDPTRPHVNPLSDTTAVRGAVAPGILRYMLFWSLALAVVAIGAAWVFVRG